MASLRIGIAGPSCSGKSTLARGLARALNWEMEKIFQLDGVQGYYATDYEPRYVEKDGKKYRSWEYPEPFDGCALGRALGAAGGGIADGFLIFCYDIPFDVKLFVNLPWPEQVRRRLGRLEQCSNEANESWLAIGEAEWELFGAAQKSQPGVIVLDGMLPPEELLRQALEIVKANVSRR
jgi:hypothetical protein